MPKASKYPNLLNMTASFSTSPSLRAILTVGVLVVVSVCSTPLTNVTRTFAAPATPKVAVEPGNAELAERFYDLARITLAVRNPVIPQFNMAGQLLEAATRLNPAEPRFPRMWADAMVQARDRDTAVRALTAYINLMPNDKSAMSQLVDLRAASFEVMDERLNYLRDWVDDNRLPAEVRSHIAILAAISYAERSQFPQSKTMLDSALRLNPLNMDALRMKLEYVSNNGTAEDRIATLLQMLRSNPNQVQYISRLSQELSTIGLAKESLLFYGVGFNLATKQNIAVPREFAMGYAVELLLFNQPAATKQLIDSLLLANPSDYDALALRLILERLKSDTAAADKTMTTMRTVLLNRLQTTRKALGDTTATTRPADSIAMVEWGSYDDDIKLIKENKDGKGDELKAPYSDILAEIAWMEIYFKQKEQDPNPQPTIAALHQLLPAENPLLARLDGWNFLRNGDKDQAKVKLSAVKDVDPIAALGLVTMMDDKEAKDEGTKLISRNPVGMNVVIMLDALRTKNVSLEPDGKLTAPILKVLSDFNGTWMSIMDTPGSFYTLKIEPLRVSHAFGEPMLMRVSIENKSEFPITIGPEGVIRQDLWFDAEFRGIVSQNMMGAAYDRIDSEIVLKPKSVTTKIVRVDQGNLSQLMTSQPFPALQVTFRVRTNPSTSGNGLAPAGQIVQSKTVERSGFGFSPAQMMKLSQGLQNSNPGDKINKTDLAAAIALILSQQQGNDDARKTSAQLVELLKQLSNESSSPAAVWANGTLARISPPDDRPTACGKLLNDQARWTSRLLGLAFLGPIRLEDQKRAVSLLITFEKDPTVLGYANSLAKLLTMVEDAQISGQSTTQPSTQPTTMPIAGIAPTDGSTLAPVLPVPVVSKPATPVKPDGDGTPGSPIMPPTVKPVGPEMIIPNVPLVLPIPGNQPTTLPTTQPATQPVNNPASGAPVIEPEKVPAPAQPDAAPDPKPAIPTPPN